jgi:putative spermidine/putrescine transport system permease protein
LACLGYPLAYWLSTLSARQANVLMILVLVPFWTSILVRVAAWIVLLQREGLVNSALQSLPIVGESLLLLFNRAGCRLDDAHPAVAQSAAVSVMKSVPLSYLRLRSRFGSAMLAAFFPPCARFSARACPAGVHSRSATMTPALAASTIR